MYRLPIPGLFISEWFNSDNSSLNNSSPDYSSLNKSSLDHSSTNNSPWITHPRIIHPWITHPQIIHSWITHSWIIHQQITHPWIIHPPKLITGSAPLNFSSRITLTYGNVKDIMPSLRKMGCCHPDIIFNFELITPKMCWPDQFIFF